MSPFKTLVILLLMAIFSGEDPLSPPAISIPSKPGSMPSNPYFPIGERLVYIGHLQKAGASFEVGSAVFTVQKDEQGTTFLKASAHGEKFGYLLDTTITSQIPPGSLTPVRWELKQRGSAEKDKKLIFTKEGADYWKVKHCRRNPECVDPEHRVDGVHCNRRRCRVRAHQLWKIRHQHRLETPHLDLLTAVYHARALKPKPGAEPISLRVVHDRDVWRVQIQAHDGGTQKVKAGTFETIKITLKPEPLDGQEKKFSGLFGFNGEITIWLDRQSYRPVLVTGSLPFGFMDMNARVELSEVSLAPGSLASESARPDDKKKHAATER